MISGGFASSGAVAMRSRWKSWTTIENIMSKRKNRLDPVHPGDVLREDFMRPLGLSSYAVAKAIGSTPITISLICRRQRAVSAEMALKLGRLFKVSPELWQGIQSDYDLEVTRLRLEKTIEKRVQPLARVHPAAA